MNSNVLSTTCFKLLSSACCFNFESRLRPVIGMFSDCAHMISDQLLIIYFYLFKPSCEVLSGPYFSLVLTLAHGFLVR